MSYLRFDKTLMTNLEETLQREILGRTKQELIIVRRLLIVTHANITDYW